MKRLGGIILVSSLVIFSAVPQAWPLAPGSNFQSAEFTESKRRLVPLWKAAQQRQDRGFTADDVSGVPYDTQTQSWKPIYGMSSIVWIDPTLMQGVQDAVRAKISPELQSKLIWLDPSTNHVTLIGFKTLPQAPNPQIVERQKVLSDRLIPEVIHQPLQFSAEGVGMMPNGGLFIPMIPLHGSLSRLDKLYQRHLEEMQRSRYDDVIQYPSYVGHATFAYIKDRLNPQEMTTLLKVLEELQDESWGEYRPKNDRIVLYQFDDISFERGQEIESYPYIVPEERLLSLEERGLRTNDYPDIYSGIKDLYDHQRRAGHLNAKTGQWESFLQIIEDGKTVEYAVFHKGQTQPTVYHGGVPLGILEEAELVFVQNVARAKRPARAGSRQPRADPDSPAMSKLVPSVVINEFPDEYWLQWEGPSGHPWWVMMNPFAIWPQRQGEPLDRQPYALTLSRSDGHIYQKEMNQFKNLKDVLTFLKQLNESPSLEGQQLFRIAINGWYYSDAEDAPKGGASQAQAHAQLVRFSFPIERASRTEQTQFGLVYLSTLADGWGSGFVLEAPPDALDSLTSVTFSVIRLITEKGHSFTLLAAPLRGGGLRVFIADRIVGTPDPHFTNEWAYSEFGRVVIVDAPNKYYLMTQDQENDFENLPREKQVSWTRTQRESGLLNEINPFLKRNAIESLKKITAPQDEIYKIMHQLTWEPAFHFTLTNEKVDDKLLLAL